MIDVADDDAERKGRRFESGHGPLRLRLETAPVQQSGQRVVVGLAPQIARGPDAEHQEDQHRGNERAQPGRYCPASAPMGRRGLFLVEV
ncbi:hypothetical protein N9H93_02660 [Rhizobiaceae bacterium]|nr:hypothetical protein [Rhizobiaceae bacterium]